MCQEAIAKFSEAVSLVSSDFAIVVFFTSIKSEFVKKCETLIFCNHVIDHKGTNLPISVCFSTRIGDVVDFLRDDHKANYHQLQDTKIELLSGSLPKEKVVRPYNSQK